MASTLRTGLASGVICLALAACGGGGGDRAEGVNPGPNPPNGPIQPPPASDAVDADQLTSADTVQATVTGVSMGSAPTVRFTLVANGGPRVSGVTASAIRAGLARLEAGGEFDTLSWTTDIRRAEDPVCRSQKDVDDSNNKCTTFTVELDPDAIPDSALKVQDPVATGKVARDQGTTESGGTLVANEDGSYSYTLVTDPGDPAGLTAMHRTCLQISLKAPTNNACVDFVPSDLVDPAIGEKATSLDDGFYASYDSRQLVADATCNSCHDQLAFHGGGRTATAYCTNCHNPVTADANSGNELDLAVMVHRIHQSATLPSVSGGKPYKIWGNRNNVDDYSDVSYPQKTRQCTRCHAGQEDVDYAAANGLPAPRAVITPDGHKWATYEGREACESCHDNKLNHGGFGSAPCIQCHNDGRGPDRDIPGRHRDRAEEQGRALRFAFQSITRTAPGETPQVLFSLSRDGVPLDVTTFDGTLTLGFAVDAASDYVNGGASAASATTFKIDANNAVDQGDNVFLVDLGTAAVPDRGIDTLGLFLRGKENVDGGGSAGITQVDAYAPVTASSATARRVVVDIDRCNDCHHRLSFHGSASNDNPQVCVMCHGPNLGGGTAGKEGAAFSLMIHGLHASGIRENAYRDKYTTDRVQFPGDLAECTICHQQGTYALPLAANLAPLYSKAAYTTPTAAACASCHDDAKAQGHMESAGGAAFYVTQQEASDAIETCDVCHGKGRDADVDAVHNK